MAKGANGPRFWHAPAAAGPDGLVGVGGDLRPETLLRAYSEGVFPWFNAGDPVLWWSPDPRGAIPLDGLHVSRSLARTIKSGKFRVTADAAFGEVIRACGVRPGEGTWITDEMVAAYEELHRLGHAHSVEAWVRPGPVEEWRSGGVEESRTDGSDSSTPPLLHSSTDWVLAGGIYGVAVGAAFAGESMFHRVADGSKVALAGLVDRLRERGFELFDVQMVTEHTGRMGAVEVPRAEYLRRLRAAAAKPGVTFGNSTEGA